MYTLIDRLNSLCEFLDDSFDINCGGCCLIARYIAEHFDNLNIEYKLVIFDGDDRDEDAVISEIQNNIRNKDNNSVTGMLTCNHYCIEVNDLLINSPEKYDDSESFYKFRVPNIKYTDIEWIYDKGDWNDIYNTDYSEAIENIINNFFSIYENKIDIIE